MRRDYKARSLRMKDQAPRQRMLDEHDAHWAGEEARITRGKIAFSCLFVITILFVLIVSSYFPAEANANAWQSVSDQSLVDQWGEE